MLLQKPVLLLGMTSAEVHFYTASPPLKVRMRSRCSDNVAVITSPSLWLATAY